MKKISNIMDRLVARREEAKADENGFSLLELVVAIGILLVLTVGGLIGYSAITDNARTAAATSAVSEAATQIKVNQADSNPDNDDIEGAGGLLEKLNADKNYEDIDFTYNDGLLTADHTGSPAGENTAERRIEPATTTP